MCRAYHAAVETKLNILLSARIHSWMFELVDQRLPVVQKQASDRLYVVLKSKVFLTNHSEQISCRKQITGSLHYFGSSRVCDWEWLSDHEALFAGDLSIEMSINGTKLQKLSLLNLRA